MWITDTDIDLGLTATCQTSTLHSKMTELGQIRRDRWIALAIQDQDRQYFTLGRNILNQRQRDLKKVFDLISKRIRSVFLESY